MRKTSSVTAPSRSSWPSLRVVLAVWATLTLLAGCMYVVYLRTLPPDELVMANTLSFQVMVASLFVGVPAFALLLLFLLAGSILKPWLLRSRES